MSLEDWDRFVEWEKTIPNRYNPALDTESSDYNVEHSIVHATSEEIKELLGNG